MVFLARTHQHKLNLTSQPWYEWLNIFREETGNHGKKKSIQEPLSPNNPGPQTSHDAHRYHYNILTVIIHTFIHIYGPYLKNFLLFSVLPLNSSETSAYKGGSISWSILEWQVIAKWCGSVVVLRLKIKGGDECPPPIRPAGRAVGNESVWRFPDAEYNEGSDLRSKHFKVGGNSP